MEIKQFEDKSLAHFSYAVLSKGKVGLIDPGRNPLPYYEFAEQHNARIIAVIETHLHADFISSPLEIHNKTGATIYISKLAGAAYPHQAFDGGDEIALGDITLKSIQTPGHSPESISILAINENGQAKAVFTGDTLFVGDCGRPDLRIQGREIQAVLPRFARQLYHSLHDRLMPLPDDIAVFPAHGKGSLCGKNLSQETSSTIGNEKINNWSLQHMDEDRFMSELLADLPFIPKYFPFDVTQNKTGAESFESGISRIEIKNLSNCEEFTDSAIPGIPVIDSRMASRFRKTHFRNAINLMVDLRFETWLGSIINPKEKFYLIAENEAILNELIERIAKIGYEKQIVGAYVSDCGNTKSEMMDIQEFHDKANTYTVIDVRNDSEVRAKNIFPDAMHIPLQELRERIREIPLDKPILVHCAGGYRSAAGASIIASALPEKVRVYDFGDQVQLF